jgi:CRISPR-associated protein (TIGR03986 family)
MSKRCERVFLDEDGAEYFVTDLAVEKFETLVHEYNENAKRQETPAVFRTYLPDKTVRVGDLLYFRRKENPETGETEAVELVPVQISREVDDKYLAEHFDNKDLRPCHGTWINDEDISSLDPYPEKKLLTRHRDGLCPSCHLFGTGSYKGRIRFSVAKCKDEPVWQGGPKDSKITLPLLERPRPTWSIPNKETPVPGRKFYLHHHGWKGICKDGKQPGTETSIVPDKNNRTVKALAPQNSFVFKVHFENLRKHELGLLIWSLQLERNLAHKLGMGKPLGFGSVDICVENASLFQRKTGWENKNDQIGSWVDAGKEKMQKWFGKRWHKIDHINNLRQLLFYVEDKKPNVFYPPLENNDKTKGYKELKKEFQGKDRGKFKKMLNTPWYPWSE